MARSRYDSSLSVRSGHSVDRAGDADGGVRGVVWAPWRSRAACRNRVELPEDDLWFAPTAVRGRAEPDLVTYERVQAAKQICAGCPVRGECLAFALATGQRHGIWGGRSEAELTVLRRTGRHRHDPGVLASVAGEVAR